VNTKSESLEIVVVGGGIAGVQSQTLGCGQNHLSVRYGKTDRFGNVYGGQQGAFLVSGWAGAALLARVEKNASLPTEAIRVTVPFWP